MEAQEFRSHLARYQEFSRFGLLDEERTASFMDEHFARCKRITERIGRAAAPVIAAPIDTALAQATNTGMLMRSTTPKLRGQDHLGKFMKRF